MITNGIDFRNFVINKNSKLIMIKASSKIKIIIIKWKITAPIACYILLTGRGISLLIFFCQIVEVVIAIKAITAAIKPFMGNVNPISKPITIIAPVNPSTTPIHW